MKFTPLFDRVIAVEIEKSKITESGIALSKKTESVRIGKIVAVGSGIFEDGVFTKMQVKENDTILFENHCAVPFFENGKQFLLIKQTDILAVKHL